MDADCHCGEEFNPAGKSLCGLLLGISPDKYMFCCSRHGDDDNDGTMAKPGTKIACVFLTSPTFVLERLLWAVVWVSGIYLCTCAVKTKEGIQGILRDLRDGKCPGIRICSKTDRLSATVFFCGTANCVPCSGINRRIFCHLCRKNLCNNATTCRFCRGVQIPSAAAKHRDEHLQSITLQSQSGDQGECLRATLERRVRQAVRWHLLVYFVYALATLLSMPLRCSVVRRFVLRATASNCNHLLS